MITINENTKIASILREGPAALNAIISINPKFAVLRNPVMRRLMAGRTSIGMASKIGGCSVQSFFDKLESIGFIIDRTTKENAKEKKEKPAFMNSIKKDQLIVLDVRPILLAGNDPLQLILEKIRIIEPGQVLKIMNGFEPTPLIKLLEKKGFASYVDVVSKELIETYFFKGADPATALPMPVNHSAEDWEETLKRFTGNIQLIDVRRLEMPGPMTKILAALSNLPAGMALFVYHKRIPVFLLPELIDRKFEYRMKEISDHEVQLLIYKS